MTIPAMMRPPPALVTRLGSCREITLCTRKARTSSRQRRLDTMLGEISCRARVRLVNAAKPQVDSPEQLFDIKHVYPIYSVPTKMTQLRGVS